MRNHLVVSNEVTEGVNAVSGIKLLVEVERNHAGADESRGYRLPARLLRSFAKHATRQINSSHLITSLRKPHGEIAGAASNVQESRGSTFHEPSEDGLEKAEVCFVVSAV